jgi:UDP-N-acetylmuramoylalanine--D-glutamate ligase
LSDFGKIKDKYKKDLIDNNIEWEEEGHTEDLILNAKSHGRKIQQEVF